MDSNPNAKLAILSEQSTSHILATNIDLNFLQNISEFLEVGSRN